MEAQNSVETVKSESFEQCTLTEESFSIFNIHAQKSCPSTGSFGPGLLGLRPGPRKGQTAGGSMEGGDHTDSQDTRIGGVDKKGAARDARVSVIT